MDLRIDFSGREKRICPNVGKKIMIDHVGFSVSDYARSKAFYEKALMPLDPDGHNIEAVCHASV